MKKGKEGLSFKRKWRQEVEGSLVPPTDSAAFVPRTTALPHMVQGFANTKPPVRSGPLQLLSQSNTYKHRRRNRSGKKKVSTRQKYPHLLCHLDET